MYLDNLFSDEKVNTGRQVELDIAKALSIIFMVFVHILIVAPAFNNTISPSYMLIVGNILGRPCAAPVFMFCLGVGIIYSRRSQWDTLIKRGIKIYLTGLLVNVFEFFLPCYVCGTLLSLWDIFPTFGGLLLFCIDILAFAGMAFILMGILKKLNFSNKQYIILAVALSLLGSVLRYSDFGVPVLNLFFGHFFGAAGGFAAFPLFNWFIFTVGGYIWGQYFIRAKSKEEFFKHWPIFLIVALAYFVVETQIPNGFLTDIHQYYFMTTFDAVFCLLYCHANIGLCYWLSKLLPDKINSTCSLISSNINNIYIIQWFLVPEVIILLVYFINSITFTDWMAALIAIAILIVSTIAAVYYKKLRSGNA